MLLLTRLREMLSSVISLLEAHEADWHLLCGGAKSIHE